MDATPRRKFWWGPEYLHHLKVSPHRLLLLVAKVKRKNPTNYIMETLENTLTKSSKLTLPVRTDMVPWEGHSITYVVPWPRRHHFNLITRKYQTNLNWGTFYKIAGLYSSKVSCQETQRLGNVLVKRNLKRHDNWNQYVISILLYLIIKDIIRVIWWNLSKIYKLMLLLHDY